MEEEYDVLILGSGPAGLTAAIYAGRYNLSTLVVGKSFGGTINLASTIENWPGYSGTGAELMRKVLKQAERFGAKILKREIDKVEKNGDDFILHTEDGEIKGKSLIIALGTEHRQLNIPGEKKFLGKGVSYCSTCDGNLYKGKEVIVIGGADSVAVSALYLSKICKKVHIIYRRGEIRCEPISLSKLKKTKNIEIHYYSEPTEIIGDTKVNSIKMIQNGVEKTMKTDGIFIEIGAIPAKDILKDMGLQMEGDYVFVNRKTHTSVKGVFAAGDITNNSFKQAITAAGEGAVAAREAHNYLNGKE